MLAVRNYITPTGALKLKRELKTLLYESRPELVRTVAWAASNGDRSENGDYLYGKRKLREIDRRIRFLSKRLEIAEVIDPGTKAGEARALFGAWVSVEDEDGVRKDIQIVGIDEAEPALGRVSWQSPIARALLNARVGDRVSFTAPKGKVELEVLEVRYEKDEVTEALALEALPEDLSVDTEEDA